eukprot:11772057-Ditylum_brightwellii.AAC.1
MSKAMTNTVTLTTITQGTQQEAHTHNQATPTLIPGQLITSKNKIRNKNLWLNKRFGGDEWIKEEGTFRFWLQNPNSTKMLSMHEDFAHKLEFVEKGCIGDYQPGGVCIIARGI